MPERDPVTAFRLAEDAAFARHGVTVAEHSLDLGGRTVRVLESGDGPPIVLVPGDGAVAERGRRSWPSSPATARSSSTVPARV